jgi:uncharacterized membrane protein
MAKDRNDEKLIAALLSTTTVRAAAAACGMGETKVYTRLRDPAFKEKYDAARRELLNRNAAALQGQVSAAIDAMSEIVNDPEATQQVRLNAAEAIIRNSLKLTEQTDILTRLDALEKLYK